MRVRSLRAAKLYSIGPCIELSDFSDFNLFIGPNGSGKTNVLRVLSGLPYDYTAVGQVLVSSTTYTAGNRQKNVTAFTPAFHEMSNTVVNREAILSDINGELTIDFEETTSVDQSTPVRKQISCKDSPDGHMEFVSGDVVAYARKVHEVAPAETDLAFFKQLCTTLQAGEIRQKLLNFGLFYIFRYHYEFRKNGDFIQGKKTGGGKIERDYQALPSGVLQIAKSLVSLLEGQNKPIVLVDEPELHVEPRYLRAYFEFLIWYCSRSKNHPSTTEVQVANRVDHLLTSRETSCASRWSDIPEKIGNTFHGKQVFVSSHSPVLINEFLKLSEAASIYEFRLGDVTFRRTNRVTAHHAGSDPAEADVVGTFTEVRKVNSSASSILDGLGCRGADLLQCNGVIWVEGPSDVIYIRKWLDIYSKERNGPTFVQGRDYEFQMFGGTLLDSLCAIQGAGDDPHEWKKVVEMFSFSRNAVVVIDSDARRDPKTGKLYDSSNFGSAKDYIENQFKELKSQDYNLALWFEKGNEEISTIEDYITEELSAGVPKLTKKLRAQRIVNKWSDEVTLSSFKDGLETNVERIWLAIEAWNRS
ncbi:MAG: AAA family ATPase [Pseudomonadota bacterium]